MSLIKVSNLTFAYEGSYDEVFSNVSFQIDTNWRLGFTGRNGRGKTTFLRLLAGELEYSGSITASVGFAYFPPPVAAGQQSVAEAMAQAGQGAEEWQLKRELSKLGFDEGVLSRRFDSLSEGERSRALLAALFCRDNSFLLIDEPTNHLDMAGRRIVAQYLSSKPGFILVSHDRALLDECTDHTLSINKSSIEVTSGSFSTWWQQRQRQDAFELAQHAKLKREVERLKAASQRTQSWSDKAEKGKRRDPSQAEHVERGHVSRKAAKLSQRGKSTEARQQRAIEQRSQLLGDLEEADELKIHPLPYHSAQLLRIDGLAVSYGGQPVFEGVSLTVEQGDRLALLGANGSGKSSLLKLICGQDVPHSGGVYIGSRLAVSYLPQDSSGLAGDLGEFARRHALDEVLFKAILRKLDFARAQFDKDMADYSAGQKKKVLLAKSLCEQAHLYVWDEPLNYIDVLSRLQIEELLVEHQPTMVFVEHDRAFVDAVATKVIEL